MKLKSGKTLISESIAAGIGDFGGITSALERV